jgi:hypothetical protein
MSLKIDNICFFVFSCFQETILLDSMFETPGTNVTSVHITEDVVVGKTSAQYVRSSAKMSNMHDEYEINSDMSGTNLDQERAINT